MNEPLKYMIKQTGLTYSEVTQYTGYPHIASYVGGVTTPPEELYNMLTDLYRKIEDVVSQYQKAIDEMIDDSKYSEKAVLVINPDLLAQKHKDIPIKSLLLGLSVEYFKFSGSVDFVYDANEAVSVRIMA